MPFLGNQKKYRVDHGNRTLFKEMPVTNAASKNVIADMDRLGMELSFIHHHVFIVSAILGLLT